MSALFTFVKVLWSLAVLILKLLGKDKHRWIRSLNKVLRGDPWKKVAADFPVWRTIRLGIHKTPDEYRAALETAGYRAVTLGEFACVQEEMEVDLVIVSIGELEFDLDFEDQKDAVVYKGNYNHICAHAKKMGFEMCPAEVGPALRLAYGDQPVGECLNVVMRDAERSLSVLKENRASDCEIFYAKFKMLIFVVEHGKFIGRVLSNVNGLGCIWGYYDGYRKDELFVLIRPRP